jgi:hypothetical protein
MTNELRLLAFIDAEARAGRQSPKNETICEHFGFGDNSAATDLVGRARRSGFIEAIFPTPSSRVITLTDAGRKRLADARAAPDKARRIRAATATSAGDGRSAATLAAVRANDRFMAALAKVAPVGDARDHDSGRFTRLPPPAMTAEAFS